MFKISISREPFGPNEGKFMGIDIVHGYHCIQSSFCDKGRKCKYRSNYRFHNFSVELHRFFRYYLHIKLPHLLYIHKKSVDLSGTTKCQFGKSRAHSCYDCVHCGGSTLRECYHPKREEMTLEEIKKTSEVDDKDWKNLRCTLYEKDSWADSYDKDTGELKF